MTQKNKLHGTVIDFNDLEKYFPIRNDFLDPLEYKHITHKIKCGSDLLFMPNDVTEEIIREDRKQPSTFQYAKAYFKIFIAGVLTDGRKAIVMIDDILPYLDVRVPNDAIAAIILNQVVDIFRDKYIKYEKHEILSGSDFKYNSQAEFIRFYFRTTKFRGRALWELKHFTTAHNEGARDDYSCIFARDELKTLANWVTLKNYEYITYGDKIKMKIFRVTTKNYCNYNGDTSSDPKLAKDKLIELTWDIETYDTQYNPENPSGMIPQPEYEEHVMFMIAGSIQYYWTAINTDINDDRINDDVQGELLNFVIVDLPTNSAPDKLTIVCGNEKNIILAFALIVDRIQPDFIVGFNDGGYDWRWFAERAFKKKLLWNLESHMSLMDVHNLETGRKLRDIEDYKYYKSEHVKIDASTDANIHTLNYFGYICIDVCVQLRILDPSGQYNLKYFLEKNSLGSKADMPYQKMFTIRKNAQSIVSSNDPNKVEKSKRDMKRVAHYCYIDARRCHELLKRREIIFSKRLTAHMTYTTMYAGFYRAGTKKLTNYIIAEGQKRNIFFDNNRSAGYASKYPGAYVGFPKKGVRASKLSFTERISIANSTVSMNEDDTDNQNIHKRIFEIDIDHKNKYILWKNVSADNLRAMQKIVGDHGIHIYELDENGHIALLNLLAIFKTEWTKIQKTNSEDLISVIDASDIVKKTCTELLNGHNLININNIESPVSLCLLEFMCEKNMYPVTSLDFNNLYPSIMVNYNLSPEYLIQNRDEAREAKLSGLPVEKIKFEIDGKIVRGWFVGHDNNMDTSKPGCRLGLFPSIIKHMQEQRNILKKPKKMYEYISEYMQAHQMDNIIMEDLVELSHKHLELSRKPLDPPFTTNDIIKHYLQLNLEDLFASTKT